MLKPGPARPIMCEAASSWSTPFLQKKARDLSGSSQAQDCPTRTQATHKPLTYFNPNREAMIWCRERVLSRATQVLALLAFCAALRYVGWRWRRVIDTSYWVSLPFVLSEACLILLGSGSFYMQICKYKRRQAARLQDSGIPPEQWPRVDVMVPCFKEPLAVIEKTLRAALAIDWPANKLTVLLLDDGGSQEARHMVERLIQEMAMQKQRAPPPTLRYLARLRKPQEPHHAKAGNLNHALALTTGDFLLVLDSDMVASPEILQALMPHFYRVDDTAAQPAGGPPVIDEGMAIVQSPQAFSNTLPGDPLNNNSPLFYHVIVPGWDGWKAAPCCGTNVIFSRKALKSVGNFTYGSVTEDFLTSLTLKAAGYRTAYVDETLAVGLAPEGLDSFFGQRLRWAVGGLQIFRYFNPLFKAGLTWPQRLLYEWSGGHYLLAFPLCIVLCTPFLFLLDDGSLVLTTGTVREYCSHFFPFYITHLLVAALAHRRLGWRRGARYLWRSQQEPVFMLFTYMRACLVVGLGLQFGFQVTRKDGKRDDVLRDLASAFPHLVCFVIGAACVVTGALQMCERAMGQDLRLAYLVNMCWASLVLCGLWPPIGQFWGVPVPGTEGFNCPSFPWRLQWVRKGGYEPIPDAAAAKDSSSSAAGGGAAAGGGTPRGLEEGKDGREGYDAATALPHEEGAKPNTEEIVRVTVVRKGQ